MKIIIEIPEKTNAHIRSDYGHGVRGLRIEDMEMLVDAVYHGEPYHNRPRGEWIEVPKYKGYYVCSKCLERLDGNFERFEHWEMRKENFCRVCGSDNRPRKGGET